MLEAVKSGIASIARRSLFGLAAVACLIVAIVMFSYAGYWWLALLYGPIIASAVLGGIYAVLGVILLLLARGRKAPPPPPPPVAHEPPPPDTMPYARMIAAFMDGLEAGAMARRRRNGRD